MPSQAAVADGPYRLNTIVPPAVAVTPDRVALSDTTAAGRLAVAVAVVTIDGAGRLDHGLFVAALRRHRAVVLITVEGRQPPVGADLGRGEGSRRGGAVGGDVHRAGEHGSADARRGRGRAVQVERDRVSGAVRLLQRG